MSIQGRLALLLALFATVGSSLQAWSPGTGSPTAVQDFVVNPFDRTDVLSFYNTIYTASQNYATDMNWQTGGATNTVSDGLPGTTSLTFKEDVRRRINFYRAMAGVSASITFDDSESSDDQAAALMFSANNAINHFPPTTWTDYTAEGATAAGHSNIAIGFYGPQAVDAYMLDFGDNNTEVGHRRWLLYSLASVMGTGDIPPNGTFAATNAIWNDATTTGSFFQFVSWPNSGFFPFPLIPARWSLSYPNADFTRATVTMTDSNGVNVPCTIVNADATRGEFDSFIGDNTLAWEPANLPTTITADVTYNVTISGIFNDDRADGFTGDTVSYSVTLMNPNNLGDFVTITGPSVAQTIGTSYTFNAIEEADAYELKVGASSTAPWTEGAEASPAPQVISALTGSIPLIQSAVVHTGSEAFQLTFPSDVDGGGNHLNSDFTDQGFTINRQIIPAANSQLQFYDLRRFMATTTTLNAQVSADGGNTWTTVWSQNGNVPSGGNSSFWDSSFQLESVDLGTTDNAANTSYLGQDISIRFILTGNGQGVYLATAPVSQFGVFLDDITVTNSTLITQVTTTELPGNATSFMLNSTTAGGALQAGTSYYLHIRPEVGLKWYGFGPLDIVTATSSSVTGFSSWVTSMYPTVTGGASGDFSQDGIPNGLKYAFGLDPTAKNAPSAVPQPVVSSSALTLSFNAPAGIIGVTYGAQWSIDLVNWTAVPDTGTGSNHIFTVNSPGARAFIRQNIIIAP